MGTTAFIDLNFGYAAGAAMRISGMGGGSSAETASHSPHIAAVRQ
jgi:hypothetical protein